MLLKSQISHWLWEDEQHIKIYNQQKGIMIFCLFEIYKYVTSVYIFGLTSIEEALSN